MACQWVTLQAEKEFLMMNKTIQQSNQNEYNWHQANNIYLSSIILECVFTDNKIVRML